jgi:hypothetical protein
MSPHPVGVSKSVITCDKGPKEKIQKRKKKLENPAYKKQRKNVQKKKKQINSM